MSGPTSDPYLVGLRLLARRELFTPQLRVRLARRGYGDDEIADALARLRTEGALDDRRAARAYAHDAARLKMRGRERTRMELERLGLSRSGAAAAVDAAYRDTDERALLDRAIARRLTGRIRSPAQYRRLYQALRRQGFEADLVTEALRACVDESTRRGASGWPMPGVKE